MRPRLLIALLLLGACETGAERQRVREAKSPFDTPAGRISLYHRCVAEFRGECACARLASGGSNWHAPGRLEVDPYTYQWLQREVGLSCDGRDAGR